MCAFVTLNKKITYLLTYLLKMIYFALVQSHLAYGIDVYGNTYNKHLNRLIILNNKLLRILQKVPCDTPIAKLYSNFNTFPNFIIIQFLNLFINVFFIKIISHSYFLITSSTIICYTYIIRAPERIFILNIVPWGRNLLNLKEVVCETLPDELKSVITTQFSLCT